MSREINANNQAQVNMNGYDFLMQIDAKAYTILEAGDEVTVTVKAIKDVKFPEGTANYVAIIPIEYEVEDGRIIKQNYFVVQAEDGRIIPRDDFQEVIDMLAIYANGNKQLSLFKDLMAAKTPIKAKVSKSADDKFTNIDIVNPNKKAVAATPSFADLLK